MRELCPNQFCLTVFIPPLQFCGVLLFTTFAYDVILIIVLCFSILCLVPCLFLPDRVVCCLFCLAHMWTLLSDILDNMGLCLCLLPCYMCSFPVYSRYNLFVCSVHCEVWVVEFMFFFIFCDISFLLFYLLWNFLCCACFETMKLFLLLLFFSLLHRICYLHILLGNICSFTVTFPTIHAWILGFWELGELELYFKRSSRQQNLIKPLKNVHS